MAEPNVIDLIAADAQNGKLLLIMTEDRPWNGREMFNQFHAKLGTYLTYALSDQFAKNHPTHQPVDVIVKLDCAHEPDEVMRDCFRQTSARVQELGMVFAYEVCAVDETAE